MTPQQIQELIEAGLSECSATVSSDDNTHYEATVVSGAFRGKRALQRHQLVYQTLGERMGREIHALSIQAYTPEEWAARGGHAAH